MAATIYPIDKANCGIDIDFLNRIAIAANLPAGNIILVFNDGPLPDGNQGSCISSDLLFYAPAYNSICHQRECRSWNCCVAIAKKYCLLKDQYPAYLAYLIGHELGHAYVCLTDLELHIFNNLIEIFIEKASDGKIRCMHQLPLERYCDKFGILISECLSGREKLVEEIRQILEDPECQDRQRLRDMLSLKSCKMPLDLRRQVVDFARPYKETLIDLWKKDVQKHGNDSMASCIKNPDILFE